METTNEGRSKDRHADIEREARKMGGDRKEDLEDRSREELTAEGDPRASNRVADQEGDPSKMHTPVNRLDPKGTSNATNRSDDPDRLDDTRDHPVD